MAHLNALVVEDSADDTRLVVRTLNDSGFAIAWERVETEEAMRLWYDEFDALMADVLDDNNRLIKRKEDRVLNEATGSYYGPDGDYERAVRRRNSAIAEDRSDFRRERKNGMMMARIQQTFMRVRNDLQMIGLKYEWFKIRNGNGNGSF